MAERFRDLARPTLVDVAARSTSGGGSQAAQALSEAFSTFSRASSGVGARLRTQIGERQGAEAGAAGDPEFRKGVRSLTAYGKAYNNAALRSYSIRVENDMEETAARVEAEANNDPGQFRTAMESIRDGIMEAATVEARNTIGEIYNARISAGIARLEVALAGEVREENRELLNEQIDRTIERVAFLRAQDTEEAHQASLLEEGKMDLLLTGATNDGTITETESVAARRKLKRQVIFQTVAARFDRELGSPYGDPIGFIEDLKEANKTNEALTAEEEQKLENQLLAELRERNSLLAMREQETTDADEARRAAGDQFYTARLFDGTLSTSQLLDAVENDELKPSVARTLQNELESASERPPKSVASTLFRYETNLLDFTEEDIATERDLTWDDRSRLIQERRDEARGWKGTQVAKEAFDRIDRALGLVPGMNTKLLTEEEARARDTAFTALYDKIDALPPEERQQAILGASQEIIQQTIRNQAASDLDRLQRQRAAYLERVGDPEKMSDRQRRQHEQELSRIDNAIREAENRRR